MSAVVAMIRGEKGCKSLYDRHQRDPVFGLGRTNPKQFWVALIREMVSKGLLFEKSQHHSVGGRQMTWQSIGVSTSGAKHLALGKLSNYILMNFKEIFSFHHIIKTYYLKEN